ncbi:MAG TPA: phosphoglycerate dehydrogenase [Tepidisphaeraceae bacterium]|nr:phosphoglycerate dehydrogenase [Tepidisphaeraceae bacterium]
MGNNNMKILLTTTSYQDTPGKHHEVLAASGFEVVRARGPLPEEAMIDLIKTHDGFDGFLNGDDHITAKVIDAALAAGTKLRVIAKYGIGLDSIDVKYATSKKIPVLFTPGVNHTTVAEHAIGLMIAIAKHFWPHLRSTKQGQWKRITGNELYGKTIGVIGMGRIGKEVLARAIAFEMKPIAYDVYWDGAFAWKHKVERAQSAEEVLRRADVVSLHMNLDESNRHFINSQRIAMMKKGAILINTARGGLVNEADVAAACRSGHLLGYGTDVLETEPQPPDHPFREIDNIIVTPHVGSRTFESVERQAMRATLNIVNFLTGNKDYIQANPF